MHFRAQQLWLLENGYKVFSIKIKKGEPILKLVSRGDLADLDNKDYIKGSGNSQDACQAQFREKDLYEKITDDSSLGFENEDTERLFFGSSKQDKPCEDAREDKFLELPSIDSDDADETFESIGCPSPERGCRHNGDNEVEHHSQNNDDSSVDAFSQHPGSIFIDNEWYPVLDEQVWAYFNETWSIARVTSLPNNNPDPKRKMSCWKVKPDLGDEHHIWYLNRLKPFKSIED